MAYIQPRSKNTWRILVSRGYRDGKRLSPATKLVKREDGKYTDRQWEKKLNEYAVDFEREVTGKGKKTYAAGKLTFSELITKWEVYAERKFRPKTLARYRDLLKRIIPAIGHIKLKNLEPAHLEQLYSQLAGDGMRIDTKYQLVEDGADLLTDTKKVAILSGLNERTIKGWLMGKRTDRQIAEKVCTALGIPMKSLFGAIDEKKTLSDKTISEHHKLVSSILAYAVEENEIATNVAALVKEKPEVAEKESMWYDLADVDKMLDAVANEDLKYQAALKIAINTGVRLGELGGLLWSDINFNEKTIKVSKQIQYLSGRGNYQIEGTKGKRSESRSREITISDELIDLLQQYQEWQDEERVKVGDRWQDHGCLFTQWDGKPMSPSTPSAWFRKFRRKHNLPDMPFHGLRHTFASLLISENVDMATISKKLGHSSIDITMRRYGHAIREKERIATEKLANLLNRKG